MNREGDRSRTSKFCRLLESDSSLSGSMEPIKKGEFDMRINLHELEKAVNLHLSCKEDYSLSDEHTRKEDKSWANASSTYVGIICNMLGLSQYRTLNFFKAIYRHEKKTGEYIRLNERREDILKYLAR